MTQMEKIVPTTMAITKAIRIRVCAMRRKGARERERAQARINQIVENMPILLVDKITKNKKNLICKNIEKCLLVCFRQNIYLKELIIFKLVKNVQWNQFAKI